MSQERRAWKGRGRGKGKPPKEKGKAIGKGRARGRGKGGRGGRGKKRKLPESEPGEDSEAEDEDHHMAIQDQNVENEHDANDGGESGEDHQPSPFDVEKHTPEVQPEIEQESPRPNDGDLQSLPCEGDEMLDTNLASEEDTEQLQPKTSTNHHVPGEEQSQPGVVVGLQELLGSFGA